MKKLFILSIIFLRILLQPEQYVYAQSKKLEVTLIPQKTNNLCWAASIEMILKYHNLIIEPTTPDNQFILNCQLNNINDPNLIDCSTGCPRNISTGDLIPCDIMDSSPLSIQSASLQYFDALFSKYNASSNQDNIPKTFGEIKNEIDNCRPLILIVPFTGDESPINTGIVSPYGNGGALHALVVKGYCKNTCNYLWVNDPWSPEIGKTYLLKFDPSSIVQYVYNIHPQSQYSKCNSCEGKCYSSCSINREDSCPSFPPIPPFLNKFCLFSSEYEVANYSYNNLCDCRAFPYFNFINLNSVVIPQYYFRYDSLLKSTSPSYKQFVSNKKYSKIIAKQNSSINLLLTENSSNQFSAEEIGNNDIPNFKDSVTITTVNNNKKYLLRSPSNPYSIIKYQHFYYDFYVFEDENKNIYFSPFKDYDSFFISGKKIAKGLGYPEKDVLVALRQKTLKYETDLKNKYPNIRQYVR